MDIEWGILSLPENAVILLEEETGSASVTYALQLAAYALEQGKKVVYLTPRHRDDVRTEMATYRLAGFEHLEIVEGIRDRNELVSSSRGTFLVIDQFSSYYCDAGIGEMRTALTSLQETSRADRTILLVSGLGVLPPRHEHLLQSSVDGIIRFLSQQEGGKIKRSMYIPKMKGSIPPDKVIPFSITGNGLLLDTRERHG
jgi:KaiC/GvpD/RAD55 family RecA-like ATPase